MTCAIPTSVGGYNPVDTPLTGLLDLSPCDDGTLTAVFSNYPTGPRFQFAAGTYPWLAPWPRWGYIYTVTPEIDRKAGTLRMKAGSEEGPGGFPIETDGWDTDETARAHRVHKQPIFCWTIIEGLIAALQSNAAEESEASAARR